MSRRRHPVVAPCRPLGALRPPAGAGGAVYRCGRAWRCGCGAQLHRVPLGEHDWTWADEQGRQTVPTEFGRALFADPLFWEHLAENDIATYSRLRAAYSLLMVSTYHAHRAAACGGVHGPLDVPECCGEPMHAQPAGWACRRSGQRWPYAIVVA